MDNLQKLADAMNANGNFYLGSSKSGKPFISAHTADGVAHFMNRVPVFSGIDANGRGIVKVDDQNRPVYTWAPGDEMQTRN